MSSIIFTFIYDDGTNRPYNAELEWGSDKSHYEVLQASVDGLIALFELWMARKKRP